MNEYPYTIKAQSQQYFTHLLLINQSIILRKRLKVHRSMVLHWVLSLTASQLYFINITS